MLEKWRTEHTVTREELAQRVQTSAVSIWRIESGKQTPSLRLAARLEKVTGIPASSFIVPDSKQ